MATTEKTTPQDDSDKASGSKNVVDIDVTKESVSNEAEGQAPAKESGTEPAAETTSRVEERKPEPAVDDQPSPVSESVNKAINNDNFKKGFIAGAVSGILIGLIGFAIFGPDGGSTTTHSLARELATTHSALMSLKVDAAQSKVVELDAQIAAIAAAEENLKNLVVTKEDTIAKLAHAKQSLVVLQEEQSNTEITTDEEPTPEKVTPRSKDKATPSTPSTNTETISPTAADSSASTGPLQKEPTKTEQLIAPSVPGSQGLTPLSTVEGLLTPLISEPVNDSLWGFGNQEVN